MLAPAAGNVSLRTVSSSRPQLFRTESQQSAVASDDYYSLSSRTPTSRSASGGSRTTVVRYATPNSHPVSRTSSPTMSRTLLAPPAALPRAEHSPIRQREQRETFVTQIDSTTQSSEGRNNHLGLSMDGASGEPVRDSYAGREPTPGMDDSPYIRFAINQLTREGEEDDPTRFEESGYESNPRERLVWDGSVGHFVRAVTPAPQQQSPPQRDPQASIDPEAFVPVEPPEGNLIYPALKFLPVVLRPWALSIAIFCVLLMIAGVAFSNVWSKDHDGVWRYNGRSGARYFVVQFLPQILGIMISISTFVIQAAVYRVMPFVIMASERPYKKILQGLPLLPRNFLLPDFSHFMHGEALVGFSLITIWLSNFSAVPLLSCFFQAKWFVIDGEGCWRWAAVRAVGWTLIAIYGLLAIGLMTLLLRFLRTRSGLMWDPVCLADLITIIQRSNVLPDFEYTETATNVGESLKPRTLRLGYWQLSHGRHPEIFYGMGEAGEAVGNPSLHIAPKNRQEHLSKVSFDAGRQSMTGKDGSEELHLPTVRYRWAPWFLRKPAIIAWTVIICALFIAFIVVSFVDGGVEEGFPPRLSTRPSSAAFSSSNFLYSFIPALIGNLLFIAWQHIDVYFRAVQPYVMLSSPEGATAEQSLLLAYPSLLPFQVTITAIVNKHYKVAWISLVSVLSGVIPILAGGVFMALTYTGDTIKVTPLMSAFYAIVAFCAVYMISFLAIWPGHHRYLPHGVSTLADQMSFLYQSPLLSDKLLREPRSKTDLVTRLVIAPPGDKDYPKYGFGVYVPGGLYLPMEDIVTALFFNSYIYTPRDPLIRPGSMEVLPQLYAAAPFDSHLRMSALAVAFFGVAAWTRQENLLWSAQQCFGRALARTRRALQGDFERNYNEILMTLVLLYIFEEFISIKENKPSPKHHLRGAIALVNNCSPERRISPLSVYSAVDRRSPLLRTPTTWPLSPGIPELASSRLMMIATPLVKLRERWVEFSARADTAGIEETEAILSEARTLDDKFLAWTNSLPKHWYPMPAAFFPPSVRDAGAYQGRCDCCTDVWIAETWNSYRIFRLSVQDLIYRCLSLLPYRKDEIESTLRTARALATDICASVPFYLGSQTGSMRITDSRVEYPAAETKYSHQQAPLVGGWLIRPALDTLCSVENLPEDLVEWARGQVRRVQDIYIKMVLSWFRSNQTDTPPSSSSPSSSSAELLAISLQQSTPTPAEPNPPSTPPTKPTDSTDDLPKLWTPSTNKKLFFGGAFFFALSLLTTRRALTRRFNASIPPYYTSSIYHKPEVNGGMEAFEALHLATINVLSFSMMASGGVLWAMGVNSIEDMRAYVKKRMAAGNGELSQTDQEMEKEVEEWVMKYLGKRIENGKLKDLNEPKGST
ncbi:hypothetical protein BDW66DRAFT_167369 [Aspergillus desertorum]